MSLERMEAGWQSKDEPGFCGQAGLNLNPRSTSSWLWTLGKVCFSEPQFPQLRNAGSIVLTSLGWLL